MIPTTALESMPPLRNAPSGTSDISRRRTAASSSAAHLAGSLVEDHVELPCAVAAGHAAAPSSARPQARRPGSNVEHVRRAAGCGRPSKNVRGVGT